MPYEGLNRPMLELVLARHGQSYGNLDLSLGLDTDLTDLGREQATRLGNWLAEQGYAFTALYCSTLRRARQTAEISTNTSGCRSGSSPTCAKLSNRTWITCRCARTPWVRNRLHPSTRDTRRCTNAWPERRRES
jgi:bisphosphoglycerate-dependent phosphoglycerate mutase